MYLDFAPMEGITGAAFRRLHHEFFPGVDHYYAPFLSPTQDHRFTPREISEILPDHNADIRLIPQLMTRNPDDFLWAAGELHQMGYEEVNLNAGCPSGTVTAKGKGAGMLSDVRALDEFLHEIYSHAPCRISIKTRLGMSDPEEFEPILEVYNRYPMPQLIIHPRVRKDFYRHPVRTEAFAASYRRCKNPISYNGDIVRPSDFLRCAQEYPGLTAIMIGQGLVSDPFLAEKIKFGHRVEKEKLLEFHNRLFDAYTRQFNSRNNAAQRMKELWFYWLRLFADSRKLGKQLLKSGNAEEYLLSVNNIFRNLPLLEHSTGDW